MPGTAATAGAVGGAEVMGGSGSGGAAIGAGGKWSALGPLKGRWRAQRHEEPELRPVVVDDRLEVPLASLGEQVEAVLHLDRPGDRATDPSEVLTESVLCGGELPRGDIDLAAGGRRRRQRGRHLAADLVDRQRLVAQGHANLRAALIPDGHVPESHVLERPVGTDVEVGPAAEVTQERLDQVTATAEGTAAESDPENRQQGAEPLLPVARRRNADGGGARAHLGPVLKRHAEQVLDGAGHVDERDGLDPGDQGMDPHHRVEMEPPGQSGRGDGNLLLPVLDLPVEQQQGRRRTVGVGLGPLPFVRVHPRQPGKLGRFRLGLVEQLQARLGEDQVEVERGHVEQDVVDSGLGVEPRPIDVLMGGQRLEDDVGQRADDVHRRDADRFRGDRPRPAADIERLLVEGEDLARRPLEVAGVAVIADARIQGRQCQDLRPLQEAERLADPLPGLGDLGVLHLRQTQGRREVDRVIQRRRGDDGGRRHGRDRGIGRRRRARHLVIALGAGDLRWSGTQGRVPFLDHQARYERRGRASRTLTGCVAPEPEELVASAARTGSDEEGPVSRVVRGVTRRSSVTQPAQPMESSIMGQPRRLLVRDPPPGGENTRLWGRTFMACSAPP